MRSEQCWILQNFEISETQNCRTVVAERIIPNRNRSAAIVKNCTMQWGAQYA